MDEPAEAMEGVGEVFAVADLDGDGHGEAPSLGWRGAGRAATCDALGAAV
jgi:hypothetical protein